MDQQNNKDAYHGRIQICLSRGFHNESYYEANKMIVFGGWEDGWVAESFIGQKPGHTLYIYLSINRKNIVLWPRLCTKVG